ncbi:hypothetical protein LJC29_00575 [Bacteroides sp. OttesenSCG-928-N06]|nr:hypothetical protein [Bacteroides sp. OttesenSCG-928-N06]
MKLKLNLLFFFLAFITACSSGDDNDNDDNGGNDNFTVQPYDPVSVTKTNAMQLYAHYMPWFETPETNNGKWGQHWTMANKDPNKVGANGKREIAAHFYPLIGPYASGDADVIEYHLLLMKYSGIDGVLIDWYGTRDYYDYAANSRNTEAFIKGADKIGLKYAIVYEDQTLRDGLEESAKVTQARADMRYLETTFFNRNNYIKINGKPLLLTFGPQEIKKPADWTSIFSVLSTKPVFLPLYGHSDAANNASSTNAQGEFIWVDAASMETKYDAVGRFDIWMGGAYPGFKGYYKDGGWGNNPLNDIDHENGALLKRLLQMAKDRNAEHLQLITWNDFGEGTIIEPTQEFGYKFLTEIQAFAGTSYSQSVLTSVLDFYNLRKEPGKDELTKKKLEQIYYYFISLQADKAQELINELK